MATAEQPIATRLYSGDEATTLAGQWRKLTRAATAVAVLTSPAVFLWFHEQEGWNVGWSIVGAFLAIAAFRGFVDIVLRRFIPWPSLFGTDEDRVREEDVVNAGARRSGASSPGSRSGWSHSSPSSSSTGCSGTGPTQPPGRPSPARRSIRRKGCRES